MKITKGYLKKVIMEEFNKTNEAYGIESDKLIDVELGGEKYEVEYDGEESVVGDLYIISVNKIPQDNLKPEFIQALKDVSIEKLSTFKRD